MKKMYIKRKKENHLKDAIKASKPLSLFLFAVCHHPTVWDWKQPSRMQHAIDGIDRWSKMLNRSFSQDKR